MDGYIEKENAYPDDEYIYNETFIGEDGEEYYYEEPLISLFDVVKEYDKGTVKALNGINLDIFEGEFVSIIGPSGSGKSTLLNQLLHEDRAIVSDIHGTTRDTIEDTLEQIEFRRRGYELLKKHLEKMSERDREILVARKLRQPVATLESLSQKYGISRERVRQIKEKAIRKLKGQKSILLKSYLGD